jgi:hypothetical protein
MWIYTTLGFFSIVDRPLTRRKRRDPSKLQVRARVQEDLVRLNERLAKKAAAEIISTPKADYPFRMMVDRKALQKVIGRLVAELDYDNFKDRVADLYPKERERHRALGLTWEVAQEWGVRQRNQFELTPERIDDLLAFRKFFDKPNFRAVVPRKGYAEEVVEFFRLIRMPWWFREGAYDKQRAQDCLEHPEKLATASIEDVRNALVFCSRGEHWCDGFWGEAFTDYWPQALLTRLADIRKGVPKTKLPKKYVERNRKKRPGPEVIRMKFEMEPGFRLPKVED